MARKKKAQEAAPEIKVGGMNADGTLVLDGNMLPPKFHNIHIKVGNTDYVISMETIKCRLRAFKDKYKNKSAEEIITNVSERVGEQVAEMSDYAEKEQVKEGVVGYVLEFLLNYFTRFIDNVLRRVESIVEGLFALVYKFFLWLGGIFCLT
jgi:hypothetical protein